MRQLHSSRSDRESTFKQQFSGNHEISAVIEHILTVAQSFGSQDYNNKFLMTILRLTCVLFCENEQT